MRPPNPALRLLPLLPLTLATLLGGACAHRPAVQTDQLPLRRVVIYRNGVAYFEREGQVDGRSVEFRVRPEHVGDFLATLSVVGSGGAPVRAAAFPLERTPEDEGDEEAVQGAKPLEKVRLELDGRRQSLKVGYVVEQPVWRPSYRLVFTGEQPVLQAWGIVQNISGQDWRDVSLSLVAGAPIAFRATLATPVTPQRPVVADHGEVILSVPRGQTSLGQDRAKKAAPMPPPPPMSGAPGAAPPSRAQGPRSKASRQPRAEMEMMAEADEESAASYLPSDLGVLAGTTTLAGATRYELPHRVTIPDQSATMVLVLAKEVPGEAVFLFAPDGGVPDSRRHPFRVVRFTNDTQGLLERGPIAVFRAGSFLGQGLLEPLPPGAEASVPFALERGLAVDQKQEHRQEGARLAQVETAVLTIEREAVQKTTYRIQNGDRDAARVLIRHPRAPGTRLHEPPEGTRDQVGKGNALVPVEVRPRGTDELVVEEHRTLRQQVDWFSAPAEKAVESYLADPASPPAQVALLREAWTLREQLRTTREGHQRLSGQRRTLEQAAGQTRQSLKSIQRSGAQVADLRRQLSKRLGELEAKLAQVTSQLLELELRQSELTIRFAEKIRELDIRGNR